jgi:hypothetical protein
MKTAAFTVVELLIVLVVAAVLLGLLFVMPPGAQERLVNGKLTGMLSNARQLHMVTVQMTLDNRGAREGMEWTMWRSQGKTSPVSLATYFAALTNNNAYLTPNELRKLLSVPGVIRNEPLEARNIWFKIFQFDDSAPPDQPFVTSANWRGGEISDQLLGHKGFILFKKGGGGGIYKLSQGAETNLFPANINYETLK